MKISNIKNKTHSIFVFALHSNIKKDQKIFMLLLRELVLVKIISKDSLLLNFKWTNMELPNLHDEDLINIKKEFFPNIDYLLTDNFSDGIGE